MPSHLFPPFRAEHIGSLKRPAALLSARAAFDKKGCSAEELERTEDEAIKNIVQMQREAGIGCITDGEFRRHMFYDGVFDNLESMKYIPDPPLSIFMLYVPDIAAFKAHHTKAADAYICEGKIVRTKSMYKSQFQYLQKITPPELHKHLKLTMCAPEWCHLHHGPYTYNKSVYATDSEYFADVAKVYQEEIKELYEIGCRNIQFDDPLLAYFCHEKMLKGMAEYGTDSDALLDSYIGLYNDSLKGRPEGMTVGLHLCRGNFKDGQHFSEGGYDRIAVKLFNEINVDCYYLEYDTERAGTFEPLKALPKEKVVILGLVSSKLAQLEDKEVMKAKIYQAAEIMSQSTTVSRTKEEALAQLAISPQCGFASHSEGNKVTEEDARKKLTFVAEIAKEVWGEESC